MLENLFCRRSEILRGAYHGAMSIYLDRFLNVPLAPLPGERPKFDDEPSDVRELHTKLLATLDTRQRGDEAGRIAARYLSLGHPLKELVDTLAFAVVREDFDFHTLQMLEADSASHFEFRRTPHSEFRTPNSELA